MVHKVWQCKVFSPVSPDILHYRSWPLWILPVHTILNTCSTPLLLCYTPSRWLPSKMKYVSREPSLERSKEACHRAANDGKGGKRRRRYLLYYIVSNTSKDSPKIFISNEETIKTSAKLKRKIFLQKFVRFLMSFETNNSLTNLHT